MFKVHTLHLLYYIWHVYITNTHMTGAFLIFPKHASFFSLFLVLFLVFSHFDNEPEPS